MGAQARDVMIVINLNRRERKRPTTDLCTAYGCGILFSLHRIALLSPESARFGFPVRRRSARFHSLTHMAVQKRVITITWILRFVFVFFKHLFTESFGFNLKVKTILYDC